MGVFFIYILKSSVCLVLFYLFFRLLLILASGRPLFGITPIARELELDKKGGYILAYNGSCIVDCKTGKQMSATIMPQDCIADICSLARANGVYALTYADTVSYTHLDVYKRQKQLFVLRLMALRYTYSLH